MSYFVNLRGRNLYIEVDLFFFFLVSLAAAYSLVLRWAGLRPHFSGVAVSLCQSVSLVQNEMSTC